MDCQANPRGSLSAVVPPRAISQASLEVQQTLADQSASKQIKKHGNMVTAYTEFHLVCCHFRSFTRALNMRHVVKYPELNKFRMHARFTKL